MEIRHARPEELDLILELFEQAKEFMRKNGNPNQWGGKLSRTGADRLGYPDGTLLCG